MLFFIFLFYFLIAPFQQSFCTLNENCSITIIEPHSCVNSSTQSCDFILSWNLIDQNLIEFKLTKLNFGVNEWIAIKFTNDESKSTSVDAIIGLLNKDLTSEIFIRYTNTFLTLLFNTFFFFIIVELMVLIQNLN